MARIDIAWINIDGAIDLVRRQNLIHAKSNALLAAIVQPLVTREPDKADLVWDERLGSDYRGPCRIGRVQRRISRQG